MELKLKVIERIILSNICPPEDSFLNLVARKELLEKLTLTTEEVENFEVKEQNGSILWNENKEKEIVIKISDSEKEYLSSKLIKLNKDEKLNFNLIDVYKKITK